MVVDQVVGRIRGFAELRQDHLFLACQMLPIEVRGARQVGDQLGD